MKLRFVSITAVLLWITSTALADESVQQYQQDAQALYNVCTKHTPQRVKSVVLAKACTANGAFSGIMNFFSSEKKNTDTLVQKTETSRFILQHCKASAKDEKLMSIKMPCAFWACNQVHDCYDSYDSAHKGRCLETGACVMKIHLSPRRSVAGASSKK